MQLPRVIIAAVFFIIGALIAIPALTRSASSSPQASRSTLTPTATATASGTTHASAKATATAKASPHRSPTPLRHTPTPLRPTPTPARHTPTPAAPTPSHVLPKLPSTTRVPAIVALKATVSAVQCPGPAITVKVTNNNITTEDYTIEQDGQVALADRVGPRSTRSNPLALKEGQQTKIAVTWRNKTIDTVTRTADCAAQAPARAKPAKKPTKKPAAKRSAESLPHTGPDSAGIYAKIATGVAAMITGLIIFWWGGTWPRRRDPMFADGRKSLRGSGKKDPD